MIELYGSCRLVFSRFFVIRGNLRSLTEEMRLFESMVVGARQFFTQSTLFLENIRVLSKSLFGIFHYLISITKL